MNKHLGGKKPHKTKSQRRIITIQEWARFYHLSRQTVTKYIREYEASGMVYDPRDIFLVLDFSGFLDKKREEKIKALKGK